MGGTSNCSNCGSLKNSSEIYYYVDGNNIAITNNSPALCLGCYTLRYKPMNIRKQIKAKIKKDNIPVSDIVDATGIHRTSIQRYLKDEFDLSSEKVSKILTYLGAKITLK